MKLAEALAERGDIDKKLRDLRQRAKSAARYVEGEEPAENAEELLGEARKLVRNQAQLITRINLTNAVAEVEAGVTITEAIADRNRLSEEVSLLHDIANEGSPARDPYSRGRRRVELPEKTDLPVKELRAEADRLAKEHRRLDGLIQQANWNTELQ